MTEVNDPLVERDGRHNWRYGNILYVDTVYMKNREMVVDEAQSTVTGKLGHVETSSWNDPTARCSSLSGCIHIFLSSRSSVSFLLPTLSALSLSFPQVSAICRSTAHWGSRALPHAARRPVSSSRGLVLPPLPLIGPEA